MKNDSRFRAKQMTLISFSQKSELGVTEHIEGDECKFAIWTGRVPMAENKMVLKVRREKENLTVPSITVVPFRLPRWR